jgi:hypothetical protein
LNASFWSLSLLWRRRQFGSFDEFDGNLGLPKALSIFGYSVGGATPAIQFQCRVFSGHDSKLISRLQFTFIML